MDLKSAIEKHSEWKTKLRSAIAKRETLDAVSIGRDDCCEFGKWLHGPAKQQVAKLGAYQECLSAHAAFHAQAGKVAGAINAKKYAEAEAMLAPGTPYAVASSSVASAVMHLKKQATL